MPAPIMAPITRMPRRVKVPSNRSLNSQPVVAATTMAMPPMVGVPALVRWPAGPSSRIGWPTRWRVSQPMRKRVPTSDTASAIAGGHEEADHASRPPVRGGRASSLARRPPGRRTATTVSPMVWVVSWPLPAITTASPGAGRGQGQGDGRPAVGLDQRARRRADRWCVRIPVLTASMMAPVVLPPRVVGRQDYTIGQRGRHLAHGRALGGVALAAAAEHHRDLRPVRSTSRTAASSCSRPSGVWA